MSHETLLECDAKNGVAVAYVQQPCSPDKNDKKSTKAKRCGRVKEKSAGWACDFKETLTRRKPKNKKKKNVRTNAYQYAESTLKGTDVIVRFQLNKIFFPLLLGPSSYYFALVCNARIMIIIIKPGAGIKRCYNYKFEIRKNDSERNSADHYLCLSFLKLYDFIERSAVKYENRLLPNTTDVSKILPFFFFRNKNFWLSFFSR